VWCFKIHIDGHSDEEIPEYEQGMPFFRHPSDESEIRYLAQKNDVFIKVIRLLAWVIPQAVNYWPFISIIHAAPDKPGNLND
jgi:hypothetical protein